VIGAFPNEIVWTSGATEANNLAIQGVAQSYGERGNHIVTRGIEHKSVLDACGYLERKGFSVTYLPVEADGRIEPAKLEAALSPRTVLVSIMLANNKIGVIQPVHDIGAIVKKRDFLSYRRGSGCWKNCI
jgi:cysteine desulfurase